MRPIPWKGTDVDSLDQIICKKCGRTLPATGFYKDRSRPSGLHPYCKECKKLNAANWYATNHERGLEARRAYYAQNRDESTARKKQWIAANRERHYAVAEAWRRRNPETVKAAAKRRREANPELHRQYWRARQARKRGNESFVVLPREVQRLLRSVCVACGSGDRIEIDHVIPVSRGGRESIGNMQPLCRSCNASKGNKLMSEWRYRRR